MVLKGKHTFFPCSKGMVGHVALPVAAHGQVVMGPGPFQSGAAPPCIQGYGQRGGCS